MKTLELKSLGACKEAVDWVATQPDAATAWRTCQRGDWMLWLAGRLSGKPWSVKRRRLVLCACECARLALKYVRPGEDRPRLAIEAAEKWARHEGPTLDEIRAAAAYAADADAYAYAAYAAYSAYAAAYASYAYAAAAAYAADAAAASYAAARVKTLSACADIVRKHYPRAPRLKHQPKEERP